MNSHDLTNQSASRANRTPRKLTPTQQLLTFKQAEEYSGVPIRSLYDLIKRGHLPTVKFPDARRHWIRRRDLDELIEKSWRKESA